MSFGSQLRLGLVTAVGCLVGLPSVHAQSVVIPGTGRKVAGDDFEDTKWTYQANLPKSSTNLDRRTREPLGVSANGKWFESAKRGQPDVIKRVDTPKGGLPGSKGAMLFRTLQSGIPGYRSATSQQDDLLFDTKYGSIPLHQMPSVTVRVYLPEFDKWEKSTDTSFGFRTALMATTFEIKRGLFRSRRVPKRDMFYPGMFIQFQSKADGHKEDSAHFIIRADDYGRDFIGPKITKTGWWTLGMSFTRDGRVHYFAHPGVEKLTMKDLITSSSFGGVRFETFETFFFNVVNKNDGKTWSTSWIIDDPALHVGALQEQAAGKTNSQQR